MEKVRGQFEEEQIYFALVLNLFVYNFFCDKCNYVYCTYMLLTKRIVGYSK